MKIIGVKANNRKRAFEVLTANGEYSFPFAKLLAQPTRTDRVREVYPDPEAGCEAFTYRLESGAEDTVHLDQCRLNGLLKEFLGSSATLVAAVFLDYLRLLGCKWGRKVLRENVSQRPMKPDILYVGEVAVRDAVVIGRVGQDCIEVVFCVRQLRGVSPGYVD